MSTSMVKKMWSGRFHLKENSLMEKFNASLPFDKRLYQEDIRGSMAHADMLNRIGVLSAKEHQQITSGLKKIQQEMESGKFLFSTGHEDIHMAIEARLTELIGKIGGKIHTARSRNDQTALNTKLYLRSKTKEITKKISRLQKELVSLAEKNLTVVLCGYTHLQRAQPVLLSHHLLAYFEMLKRDFSRFNDNLIRMDECPLGAGALAGTPHAIDRKSVAKALQFSDVTHNSLDTVSDRDFVLDFLTSSSILMMHLSRFSEELILWNSQEFGFVILPQEFCTGSSMMPQKINPDAPELIRGKTGRVYGNLMSLLTTMKGLPLSYNKDAQEDKEPLFDSIDTLNMCLDILITMLPKIKFNKDTMMQSTKQGFVLATDMADYLVKKNLPFRDAHQVVGQLIAHASKTNSYLEDLDLKALKKFSTKFEKDVFKILNIENSINARKTIGGTALSCVKNEIQRAKTILKAQN